MIRQPFCTATRSGCSMYKGDIMATLISVLTNQFFLIFLAIALGLLLGK